jgi:hypothetical protein
MDDSLPDQEVGASRQDSAPGLGPES